MTYNVFGGTLNFALSIYLSTLHPQSITALWLVHIAPTHEGMARLSWPGGYSYVPVLTGPDEG